jgi:hypothetical protein
MKQDPPELQAGIEMLRKIYWREYGRGWREACQHMGRILQSAPPLAASQNIAECDPPAMGDWCGADTLPSGEKRC